MGQIRAYSLSPIETVNNGHPMHESISETNGEEVSTSSCKTTPK